MTPIICHTPAPACVVPCTHPARAHTPWTETDIRDTLERHRPIFVCAVQDDYELTERLDYLERLGAFA